MLSQRQLIELLNNLEADAIERTTSVNDTDKFAQAICAFANDLPNHRHPGYLLIGARDDGTPSGLKVTDELLRKLGAIRSDGNVLPQPTLTVQKIGLEDGDIAAVKVELSDLPPVRYKGRIYIRIGPRKGIANEQEATYPERAASGPSALFRCAPMHRNPIIAEAMKALGFVNRFGYGVQRAQALLKQNGNPPPEFEFDEHSVLVKIRQRIE